MAKSRSLEDAIENAFHGVTCLYAQDFAPGYHELRICLTGSGADLVRHGLITRLMLDLVPPCGARSYRQCSLARLRLPFTADVSLKPDGTYRVSRNLHDAERQRFLQRIGVIKKSAPPALGHAAVWIGARRRRAPLRLVWVNPVVP